MQRRAFLLSPAAALAQPPAAAPKRLAAILTEYRKLSHADVVVGKYLEGYNHDDQPPYPQSKIVSMFTEQAPQNDMSRERAARYGVPVFRTVRDALTLGSGRVAVDGVLLIGEHGEYPLNDKGQKLYPRYEMFLKITDVFRETGQTAPVFNDKHLSWNWYQARRMVEISRELGFPLMAGSSVPVAFRVPAIDTPYGEPQKHAVVVSFGGLESYGYHGLEAMQALVERRRGGETGVEAVQCLEDEACWRFLDGSGWARRLFDRALTHSESRKPGEIRQLVKRPAVFIVNYNDGLTGAVFQMPGLVEEWLAAVDVEGRAEPVSMLLKLQRFGQRHHFGCLIKNIEKMFATGEPPYPVERTMLTSGILDFALDSRLAGHRRVGTPELARVRYRTPDASHFCTQGWDAAGKRLDM
jgi:hypothetical protein